MRKSDSVVFLVAGLLTVSPSGLTAANLSAEADGIRAELSTDPERPARGQETTYKLRLFDSAGKPLTGARVALHGRMADGMTVLAPLRPLPEPGIYRGRVLFTMEGTWELTLRVRGEGRALEFRLTENVGR